MLYLGNFNDVENNNINVEIINSVTGPSVGLMLADDPIKITSASDGIFSPIKANSATIRILTENVYSDMYSSTSTGTSVKITKNDKVIFRGYLTPNIYTQGYEGLDILELEAVSAISALKNIKYKEKSTVRCWYDIIREALRKVGYNLFYISNSYKYNVTSKKDFLTSIHQFEDNFFDNDEERTPWTYYDILEQFCKYFGLSLMVYNDEIYFIDYNNINNFIQYKLVGDTSNISTIISEYNITKDSYKSNGANISYDETYNKIAIKDNLYEMNDVVPDPFDKLKNQNADQNKYYVQNINIEEGGEEVNYTYLNGYFKSEKWEQSLTATEITPENVHDYNDTSFFQKAASYKTEDEPSSLSWKTYLTGYSIGQVFSQTSDFCMLKLSNPRDFIANGGYFIFNMDFKLSNNIYANDCFKTSDQVYSDDKFSEDIYDTLFPCRLYIGDYYYDGLDWVNKSEYERKYQKGYYKSVNYTSMHNIPTWYKYKDADGDWKFCLKDEWDIQTGEKESGEVTDTNRVYYYNGETGALADRIYVDEPFYNECYLMDRFYLVRKNKKDDKIFDEIKQLTNTVSWRMNIVNSEDGVAIKLPDKIISGKLRFEVFNPTILGTYPQYRSKDNPLKAYAVHIDKFELVYKVTNDVGNIYENNLNDDDVIYTNVINDDYVNEWDDLEIKINSQVDDRITSLSSVLYKEKDLIDYVFLDSVFDITRQKLDLLENHLINRYYEHYKSPKVILQACLENKIYPYTKVHESNLHKDFIMDQYEISVLYNTLDVKLIEI